MENALRRRINTGLNLEGFGKIYMQAVLANKQRDRSLSNGEKKILVFVKHDFFDGLNPFKSNNVSENHT